MTSAELAALDEAVFAWMDGLERSPYRLAVVLSVAGIVRRVVSDRMVRAAWHRLPSRCRTCCP